VVEGVGGLFVFAFPLTMRTPAIINTMTIKAAKTSFPLVMSAKYHFRFSLSNRSKSKFPQINRFITAGLRYAT
jgi:hypothetical protein